MYWKLIPDSSAYAFSALLNTGMISPPSPPSLGGIRVPQSPPGLGDLGGKTVSNVSGEDLCVHRSQLWGEPILKVPQNWGASGGYAGVSPSRGGSAVLGSPQVERLPSPGVDLGG